MKKVFFLGAIALSLFFAACNDGSAPAPDAAATTDGAAAPEAAAAPAEDVAALLQGKWQSAEDPKSMFEVAGGEIVQYYDGKKLDARKFQYSADCSGNECAGGAGNKGCYSSAGEVDIECYSVVTISATDLETSMVGATGNTLKYKKV